MAIRLLKLITADEVVADITVLEDGKYRMVNSVKFVYGHEGVGMVPFLPLGDPNQPIDLLPTSIVAETDLDEEVLNAYKARFGGVVIAGGGGLKLST